MKKKSTKLLALLMVFVMVFSMFPVTTLAADYTSGVVDEEITTAIDYPIWDLSTKASSGFTVNSGFSWTGTNTIGMGGWENDPRGLSQEVSGDIKIGFTFSFPTTYNDNVGTTDAANVDTGVYFYPLYGCSAFGGDDDNLRIQLSPLVGLRMSRTNSVNGAYDSNTPSGTTWGSGRPTSFELGTEYNFLLEKSGDTMKVYIWEVGAAMGDADMTWVDEDIIGNASTFQICFRPNRMGSSTKVSYIMQDLTVTKAATVTVKPVVLADRTRVDLTDPVFGGDAFAEDAVPALSAPSVSYGKHASNIFYMSAAKQIQATVGSEFSDQNLLHEEVTKQADGGFKTWVNATAGAFQFQIPVTVYPHYIAEVSNTQWRAWYDSHISAMNTKEGENAVIRLNPVGIPAYSTMKFGTLKGSGEMRWYQENHITVADGKTMTFDGTQLTARDEGAKLIVGDGSGENAVATVNIANGADVAVPTLQIDGGKVFIGEDSALSVNKLTLNGTMELADSASLKLTSDITIGNGAQIILNDSSLAEGESKLMIQTANGAALLDSVVENEGYTYYADAAGVYIQRVTSGCEHVWKDATCVFPKTCALCGMIHGTTLEHTWTDAETASTNTCAVCGLTVNNYTWEFWKDGFTKHDPGAVYNSAGNAVLETTYGKCLSGWGEFRDNGFTSGSTPGNGVVSKKTISGDYSFQAQVMLDEGNTWTTIWPQYTGIGSDADPSYRIELTHENGIRVGYDNAYRYANTAVDADKLTDNNTVTTMKLKTPYMLKWEKEGATLRIKFWERDNGEPQTWNYIINHEGVVDTTTGHFRLEYYYDEDVYTPAVTSVFRVEHIKFIKPLSISVPNVVVDMDAQGQTSYVKANLDADIFVQQPDLDVQVSYEVVEGEDVVSVDAATGELTPIKGGRARVEVTYTDGINTASATGAVRVKVACTEHTWEDATCLDPSYCSVCGETTGSALGHDWQNATCTEPKTCSRCGETTGAALGHTWDEDTDACSVCGEEMKQLRILFFGNSYSQYVAYTMYDLVKELDYDRLVIGNYVKGSTTQTAYWDWISGKDTATRTFQQLIKNHDGALTENKVEHTSALPGLTAHDWDYIVLQSYAPESGNSLTQNSAMANMVDYVNTHATNPNMQLVYPINWSSTRDMSMYNLGSTYREVWERVLASYDYPEGTSPFDVAVPIGTLVEVGRGSWYNEEVGSNLTCDGYHLDPVGNYLFVMAYMTALTDQSIDEIGTKVREMGYTENGTRYILTNSVTDAQAELCKAIIRVAYDAPHDFITYAAVTTADDQMTRYETLAEATAAAKSGDTIEILQVCKNDTKLNVARGVKVIYYTADGKVTAELPGGGYIDSTGLHGTFSVDYVLNGGNNAASNPANYSSEDETITLADAQKTGFTFGGWYTDAAFTKQITVIEQGSTGNLTLYAKWTANTYTIAFAAGEGSGEMESITATYGKDVKLPENSFTHGSKFFAGWDTDSAATMPVYGDNSSVKNLTAENGATVTLYAVWSDEEPAQAYSVSVTATLDGNAWSDSQRKVDLVCEEKTYTDYKGQAIVVPGTYDVHAENANGIMQDTGIDVTVADENTQVTVDFVTAQFHPNVPGQETVRWSVIKGVYCNVRAIMDQMTETAEAYDLAFAGFSGLIGNNITIETATEYTAEYTVSAIDTEDVTLSVKELAAGAILPQPEAVSAKMGQIEVNGVWTVNGEKITGAAVRGSEYTYAVKFAIPNGYTIGETAVLPDGWTADENYLTCTFDALTAMKQLRALFVGPDLSEAGNNALDNLLDTLSFDNVVVKTVDTDNWNTSDETCALIESEYWDYIVMQPGAKETAVSVSENEALLSFAAYAKERASNPNMKLAYIVNWSTSENVNEWQSIVDAYDLGENDSPFDLIIPVGTAIENGRRSFWSETEDGLLLTEAGTLNDIGAAVFAVTAVRTMTSEPILDYDIRSDKISLADEQLIKVLVETTVTNPMDRLTYASVNSRAYSVLNFYETLEEATSVSAKDDLLELYGICKSSERLDIASGVTVIYYTETGKRSTYLPDGGYIDADGLHSLSAVVEQAQLGTVKYETLAEALAAAQSGDTINLLADVTESVTVSKAVTVVRNGFSANLTAANGFELTTTEEAYVVAEEPEPLTGSIRLRNASLNLLDKVSIIYKCTDDTVATDDADVAERGVLLFDSAEKAATKDPEQAFETVLLEWDASQARYVGQSEGIDARDMGKSQFAVAYMKMVDGTVIWGTKSGENHVVEYSPLIYCTKNKDDATVGKLCTAMMQYGAAAQIVQYLPEDRGELMNTGFDAITYDETVLGETVFHAMTDITNGQKLRSVSMDLQGAVSYIVKFEKLDASLGTLYAEYTLETVNGVVTGDVELEYRESEGRYCAVINGIPAKDLGAKLTVKSYYLGENGEKVYGGELVYSGYEYVRRALINTSYSENVKELARALAMYIHYADAYGN